MVGPVEWRCEEVTGLRGYAPEWSGPDGYLISRRNALFRTRTLAAPRPEERVLAFPLSPAERLASPLRLGQRLLRAVFYNVIQLADGTLFLAFGKRLALWRGGELLPVTGLRREFRVLRGSAAMDDAGNVYFGEYHVNRERREVAIYCLPAGSARAEVVRTFAAGEVRHVHGIFYETQRHRLWCTTGDRGAENRIIVSDDGLRTVTEVGGGDETWRCVGLSFSNDHLLYGTDAEFRENHIYRLDLRSGERSGLGAIDGPAYYAIQRGGTHFFGTTAEGCPSQPVNAASIWRVDSVGKPVRVATWRKDAWPNAFMYGTLHFCLGPADSQGAVLCYLHGLAGQDERTIRIEPAGQ